MALEFKGSLSLERKLHMASENKPYTKYPLDSTKVSSSKANGTALAAFSGRTVTTTSASS